MRILTTIAILLLLSGCKAIREAREDRREEKVNKWLLLHPEKFAQKCTDEYPCRGDSVTSVEYTPADNEDYTRRIDSLITLLQELDSTWIVLVDSATTETAEVYQEILRQYKSKVAGLDSAVRRLQEKYKPCKPDTAKIRTDVTTLDTAAIAACRLANIRLVAEVSRISGDGAEWKAKAKERFWIIVALSAIILALVTALVFVLRAGNRVKKVTNSIDSIVPD